MRLIDADALIERLKPYIDKYGADELPYNMVHDAFIYEIGKEPTVDAVPVIRCKDCKFLRFTGTVWKCQNRLVMMLCEPNDYCSRGERKEE